MAEKMAEESRSSIGLFGDAILSIEKVAPRVRSPEMAAMENRVSIRCLPGEL